MQEEMDRIGDRRQQAMSSTETRRSIMQGTKWELTEGKVDLTAPHMKLFYGDWGESSLPVALVAKPIGNWFVVEFPDAPDLDQNEYERIKLAVTEELTFYLVEKGEPDPWKYAIYHCSTASNLYSQVHWGYFPGSTE
jgi:hypothetical protein